MALNEYAQIQDESLKCELQNCYFTKYNNGDYLNRKNSFRVQRALDKLWNMDCNDQRADAGLNCQDAGFCAFLECSEQISYGDTANNGR